MKKNNAENYEQLCQIKIDRLFERQFPIAYENCIQNLMKLHDCSESEARSIAKDMEIELELYYDPVAGCFFAVDTDAVENTEIYSPYTKEQLEEFDED